MASCLECNPTVVLKTAGDYIKHLKQSLYYGSTGSFSCPLCQISFNRMNRFDVHLSSCFKKRGKCTPIPKKQFDIRRPRKGFYYESCDLSSSPPLYMVSNVDSILIPPTSSTYVPPKTETLSEFFENIALEFALSLHSHPNLTRKDVYKIQTFITENILQKLSDYLVHKVSDCVCDNKTEVIGVLRSMTDIFTTVKTEYLLNKTLIRHGLMEPPQEFIINREVGITFEKRKAKFGVHTTKGTLLPLAFQVSEFVKRSDRVEEMLSNLDQYSKPSDAITHYIQGSTWKTIPSTH